MDKVISINVGEKVPCKLAVFISDLDCGGAQRVVMTLIEGIVNRGYSVDLILARGGGALESEVPEGVRIVRLSEDRMGKIIFIFKVVLGLARYLRRAKPDAILSSITGANLVALFVKRLVGSKAVLVLRHENTAPNLNNRLVIWLMARLYPNANAIVTVSPGAASDLEKGLGLQPDKIEVIENPVNSEAIIRKAGEIPAHPWFRNADIPILLGVGRLFPQKDFETMIRAFAKLLMVKPVRLIILGEGPERGSLEALVNQLGVEEFVDMPGLVQNPYPWMKFATVFVLSSKWEGLPVALIEAMALGCRIVATDCHSGPRELLADGKYGALVPVEDDEALKSAILETLESDYNQQYVISAAKAYSPESIVARHLKLLKLNNQPDITTFNNS